MSKAGSILSPHSSLRQQSIGKPTCQLGTGTVYFDFSAPKSMFMSLKGAALENNKLQPQCQAQRLTGQEPVGWGTLGQAWPSTGHALGHVPHPCSACSSVSDWQGFILLLVAGVSSSSRLAPVFCKMLTWPESCLHVLLLQLHSRPGVRRPNQSS